MVKIDAQSFFEFRVKEEEDGVRGQQAAEAQRPRHCGDLCFLILFICLWIAQVVVSIIAINEGKPERLVRGTDMFGNICGKLPLRYDNISLDPGTPHVDIERWPLFAHIWYPIVDPDGSGYLSAADSLKLGVCVVLANATECPRPDPGATVRVYGNNVANNNWTVNYWSKPHLGRCLPVVKRESNFSADLDARVKALQDAIDISDFWYEGVAEVYNTHKVVTVAAFLGVTYTLVWIFCLRTSVRFTAYGSLLAFAGFTLGCGAVAWQYGSDLKDGDDDSDTLDLNVTVSEWWKAFAVILWVLVLAIIGLAIFMLTRLRKLVAIVREGLRVQHQVMGLSIVAVWGFLAIAGLTVYMVYTAINIETADKIDDDKLLDGQFDIAYSVLREYSLAAYFHTLNILVWIWTISFLNHLCYTCISFCAVFWYFSARGDLKEAPEGIGFRGLHTACKYHLGTVAFGALVMWPGQILRLVWMLITPPCVLCTRVSRKCCCGCCCCRCCVSCYTNGLRFARSQAYVMTAMLGNGFCRSGRQVYELLHGVDEDPSACICTSPQMNVRHEKVVEVNYLSDCIVVVGKLIVTLANVVFSWVMIDNNWEDLAPDAKNATLPLILIGLCTYLIAGMFIDVTAAVVDNIVVCYCYDLAINAETGDYFMSTSLREALLGEDADGDTATLLSGVGRGKPADARSSVAEVADELATGRAAVPRAASASSAGPALQV